jgi:hypothetical protein
MRFPKIPVLITSFITLILIILNYFLSGTFWDGWEIEPSIVQGCFCEHNYLERFIRQPLNSWSNLAFLYAGILILYKTWRSESENESENYIKRNKIIGIAFGILLCILFTGSFLFHASLTTFFGKTDMIGTYGIPLFLGMIGISRILVYHKLLQEKTAAIVCVAVTYILGYLLAFHYIIFINMIVTFASLLIIAGLSAFYLLLKKDILFNKKLLVLNMIFVVLACILWILDHNNIVCFPYSNIQLHSFWHVLNGIAAYYMFEFFISEEQIK